MTGGRLPEVQFRSIRPHEGSQHRAWEELTYILTPTMDSLPHGTRLVRRGTPDGGIEFHCPAPDGNGVWAWQAKYLHDYEPSTFSQMRKSFLDALADEPNLTRYTYVLPAELPAGAVGVSAMKKWAEHSKKWTKLASDQGVTVTLELHGHSDVLTALLRDEHAGAHRYFFDSTFLTEDVFRRSLRRSVLNLGSRYLPEVNIETDIPSAVSALCLDEAFTSNVRKLAAAAQQSVVTAARVVAEETKLDPRACDVVRKPFADARTRCVDLLTHGDPSGLAQLRDAATDAINAAYDDMRALGTAGVKEDAPRVRDPSRALGDAVRQLQALVAVLNDMTLKGALGQAFLLVGSAGTGKSHSLADAAEARVANGAPTFLILGNLLSTNASLTNELAHAVQQGEWHELIGGLQVAARLAGKGRALIAVDAINEGAGRDLWRDRLAGLLGDLQDVPEVALMLSIRDSYKDIVLTDAVTARMGEVEHRGLAGREAEALHVYAEHFGLAVPNVPPLNPEFSNPLLLGAVCRAAEELGLSTIPDMSRGEDWIFDGLIKAVNRALSDPDVLDVDVDDEVAQRGVRAIAAAMVEADFEVLPRRKAVEVGATVHDHRGLASKQLVAALEREGILLRERDPFGDQDVTRFTYQRMSDHYRARTLLDRSESADELKGRLNELGKLRGWLDSGIVDALSSLVPARYGIELYDLVRDDEWVERAMHDFGRALVGSFAWRSPSTVSNRTREVVHELISSHHIDYPDWLEVLISVACVPDHPLNATYLHERLIKAPMARRDESWTRPVQHLWFGWENSAARVLDWLSSRGSNVPSDVRRNGMLITAWFLTSTSRRLRDTATKVLVLLADEAAGDLLHVLRDFKIVDDPYVRERLAAVALGHVSRLPVVLSSEQQTELVAVCEATVDMADEADIPHSLVAHYVRQLLEEAAQRLPDVVLPDYNEPAGPWPLEPPAKADLAVRLGEQSNGPYLANSPVGYDFREYVLDRGMSKNFALPNQEERLRRKRSNAQARKRRALDHIANAEGCSRETLVKRLEAADIEAFDSIQLRAQRRRWRASADTNVPDFIDELDEPETTEWDRYRNLYPDHIRRLSAADSELRAKEVIGPSSDLLERWIVDRVLRLGWDPNNNAERLLERAYQRLDGAEDKVERLGKKYSWIAYRELQATLSQHCGIVSWELDKPVPFTSAWQLRDGPDLDPTVALRGDRPPPESFSARLKERRRAKELQNAWWLTAFKSPMDPDATNDDAWLKSDKDLPSLETTLTVTDPNGDDWVAFEAHAQWDEDTQKGEEAGLRDRRELWVRTQSYFLSADSVPDVREWSKGQDWMGLWMRTPPDYGQGFFRQYPDHEPWASWFLESQRDHTDGWDGEHPPPDVDRFAIEDGWFLPTQREFPQHPVALATFGSTYTYDDDMSSKDLPSLTLPSPALTRLLRARPTPPALFGSAGALNLGLLELEHSWSNHDDVVMFATGGAGWGQPSALFVRGSALRGALSREGLSWWTWVLGEKITWRHGDPTANRLHVFGAAGIGPIGVDAWSLDSMYVDGPR